MQKAEIKAIRGILGYNTDLRIKLDGRYVDTIADWLEKNLEDVFGYTIWHDLRIARAEYYGGAWLRPDGKDAYVRLPWEESRVISDFCEIQAKAVAGGECTEKSAKQINGYSKLGMRLNPDGECEGEKDSIRYQVVRDPEAAAQIRWMRVRMPRFDRDLFHLINLSDADLGLLEELLLERRKEDRVTPIEDELVKKMFKVTEVRELTQIDKLLAGITEAEARRRTDYDD